MPCSNCCRVDQVRDGCADTGAFVAGHCCKCVPARVCVALYTSEDITGDPAWSPYDPVAAVEASWCGVDAPASREYSGDLVVGDSTYDFRIYFVKDYTDCWIAFESTALGYTGDDVVMVPMGGDYHDNDQKRLECVAMEFEFSVNVYGTPATVTIAPADHIIRRRPRIPTVCLYDRICITMFDGYDETTVFACQDPDGVWVGTFDAGDVTINLESDPGDADVRLSMTSPLGYGIEQSANCPTMYTRWDFDDGTWVKIIGDPQARCVDCKFHCRCLCVTFTDGETSVARDAVCVDEYQGCDTTWEIDLGGYTFAFTLPCTGCNPRTTMMRMEAPYGTTLISDPEQGIICPDQLTASWSFRIDEDTVGTVEVECIGCENSCSLDDLNQVVPCCPSRTTGIPVILYATVESSTGCPQLDGLTIPLLRQGPFSADTSCWTGQIAVSLGGSTCIQTITLQCTSSDGEENVWRVSQTSCGTATSPTNTATLISCDPLEIEITINGVGCCDGGVGATINLRITE